MFDWARGAVLKKFIEHKIPFANWEGWLKGWAAAWPLALLNIPRGSKILDIGCGSNPYYANYFSDQGCEAHVLEQYAKNDMNEIFGITDEIIKKNPNIAFHIGLAGQNIPPANYYDLITCISVLEHVYDIDYVIRPGSYMKHWKCLEDMFRMLAPGGVLVVTYDFILHDYEGHRGWDFLADIRYLELLGLPLLNRVRKLRDRTFLYNYEDTLFMTFEGILQFSQRFRRQTSVGMIFRKPGTEGKVSLSPHPQLKDLLFSEPI